MIIQKQNRPRKVNCAGGRVAYDFPIRYAPNRIVHFEALRASWSSIPKGHKRKCRTIGTYFSKLQIFNHSKMNELKKYMCNLVT